MATKKLQILDSLIKTDDTLTLPSVPADAKAVGDAIKTVNDELKNCVLKGETENESATVIGTGAATGDNSIVIGSGTASGEGSTVIGSGTAAGDYSVAEGAETIAGCKGYYIAAIDPANNYIYLHTGEDAVIPTWDDPSSFYDSTFNSNYKLYLGDVDGNGVLDEKDAELIMKYVADNDLKNFQEEVADVDKDGSITLDDSLMILKYVDGNLPDSDFEFVPYGNEFSVGSDSYYHWVFASNIIEISGNRIKYSENNSLNNTDKWLSNVDNGADPMVFFIPAQPDCGFTNVGTGSHSEGWRSHAAGQHSHAEGYGTIVAGRYGHAEGNTTRAGFAAHAEGIDTLALGLHSHAEGNSTSALANNSHVEGKKTEATGENAHAEGQGTQATGIASHAEGNGSQATAPASHAEGKSIASSDYAHAEGYGSQATGPRSHAEGSNTLAQAAATHAEGVGTITSSLSKNQGQHVQGRYNILDTTNTGYAHIVGNGTSGDARSNAHTIDWSGNAWFARSIRVGGTEYSKGKEILLSEDAVGKKVTNGGEVFNDYSSNTATASYSHAEGFATGATALASHAEGYQTHAGQTAAHAEGRETEATGFQSHAEGNGTKASGARSHAEGYYTIASGHNQHVQGKYNRIDSDGKAGDYAHIVGNGNSDATRSNAHTLDWDGNAWFAGDVVANTTSLTDVEKRVQNLEENPVSSGVGKLDGVELTGEIFNDYENNKAPGLYSHAEGIGTQATETGSHAEGFRTEATGIYAHAEGGGEGECDFVGNYDDTGLKTVASGDYSHAEGHATQATEKAAHVEGIYSIASGEASHAEGYKTKASGIGAHVEGYSLLLHEDLDWGMNTASGKGSHAEGVGTIASGIGAHAEGGGEEGWELTFEETVASGDYSHAEGWNTGAGGKASHAEGHNTVANGDYQHVQGKYNLFDNGKYAHIVGNGQPETRDQMGEVIQDNRSNAHTLDWSGNAWFAGSIKIGGTSQDDPAAQELVTKEYVAELLARIEALEAALNPVNEITFKVADNTYTAKEGMTWAAFIDSEYNPTITCTHCGESKKLFVKDDSNDRINYLYENDCQNILCVTIDVAEMITPKLTETIIADFNYDLQ